VSLSLPASFQPLNRDGLAASWLGPEPAGTATDAAAGVVVRAATATVAGMTGAGTAIWLEAGTFAAGAAMTAVD
jgi:hypothetical protein